MADNKSKKQKASKAGYYQAQKIVTQRNKARRAAAYERRMTRLRLKRLTPEYQDRIRAKRSVRFHRSRRRNRAA